MLESRIDDRDFHTTPREQRAKNLNVNSSKLNADSTVDVTVAEQAERKLLKQIADFGDSKALERFYHIYRRRLGPFLYRTVNNPAIIEEVFNDVMHIVWQKAHQFNGTSKVSTWIYSIAYRNCLQLMRKEGKHTLDESESDPAHCDSEQEDSKDLIKKSLQMLSPEHRLVIELSYFAGNTYGEIAEIADCPESTVKTRMFYARRKLHEIMTVLGEPQLLTE